MPTRHRRCGSKLSAVRADEKGVVERVRCPTRTTTALSTRLQRTGQRTKHTVCAGASECLILHVSLLQCKSFSIGGAIERETKQVQPATAEFHGFRRTRDQLADFNFEVRAARNMRASICDDPDLASDTASSANKIGASNYATCASHR